MNPFPSIRAGDTYRTTRSWPQYAASDGWQLGVSLASTAGVFTVEATGEGAAHVLAISAAVTAGWPPATYRLVEYVTRGADRHTLHCQNVQVLPDLAAASAPLDTRSHAQRVLDSVEAFLESGVEAELEIAGRRLKNYPLPELLALRDRYRAEVRHNAGGFRVGTLLTRFG